jgi:hypothetical protein
MDPEQRELYRHEILRILDANQTRFGLSAGAIVTHAVVEGFSMNRETCDRELTYLVDKELVAEVGKTLSPENRAWRITAAGRDYLASRGL